MCLATANRLVYYFITISLMLYINYFTIATMNTDNAISKQWSYTEVVSPSIVSLAPRITLTCTGRVFVSFFELTEPPPVRHPVSSHWMRPSSSHGNTVRVEQDETAKQE